MREPGGRTPAEIIALYERVDAAMQTSASLADIDAGRADAAADSAGSARAHRDARLARRAAARARAQALRLSVRAVAGAAVAPEAVLAGTAWARAEHVAAIATDLTGAVCLWNPAAEQLYGWTAAEALGRPITTLTVGPEDVAVAERIMAAIRRCGLWEGEFWVRRRDRTRFLAFVRDVAVHDGRGRAVAIAGFSVELAVDRPTRGAPADGP